MKKYFTILVLLAVFSGYAAASECCYSYSMQKKMLKNRKNVQNKVIDRQIRGKLLAIEELAGSMPCTSEARKERILMYQSDIENLTNEKLMVKNNYKCALRHLRDCR